MNLTAFACERRSPAPWRERSRHPPRERGERGGRGVVTSGNWRGMHNSLSSGSELWRDAPDRMKPLKDSAWGKEGGRRNITTRAASWAEGSKQVLLSGPDLCTRGDHNLLPKSLSNSSMHDKASPGRRSLCRAGGPFGPDFGGGRDGWRK